MDVCGQKKTGSLARAAMAVVAATMLLAAMGGPAVAASPTKLTAAQLAHMSACIDQQESAAGGGADACAEFVKGPLPGGRTRLTEIQAARMSECVDQQNGEGTPGAPDTCKEFVSAAKGRR